MNKKLQIFISSTYTDMKIERQAAVEAILSAGHIPAGMELFSAGNESQIKVIERWIDESDVFLLILGGRYGSIEPESGKSYIQLEYEYALNNKKPLFAVVIDESYLNEKIKEEGLSVVEQNNNQKFKEFKEKVVLSNLCEFFLDTKDIQLAIHKTLRDFIHRYEFNGWISGKDYLQSNEIIKQNIMLLQANRKLKENNSKLEEKINSFKKMFSNEKLIKILSKDEVTLPSFLADEMNKFELDLFTLLIKYKDNFGLGVTNALNTSDLDKFLFSKVAPKLVTYGILHQKGVYGKSFSKFIFTDLGINLVKSYMMKITTLDNEEIAISK